jgi:hypothetical protein
LFVEEDLAVTTAIVIATATTTVTGFAAGAEVTEFAGEFTFELIFKAHCHCVVGRIAALGTWSTLFARSTWCAFFAGGTFFTRSSIAARFEAFANGAEADLALVVDVVYTNLNFLAKFKHVFNIVDALAITQL